MKPLKVAMIGQRGLPATFGGIERHVEEMGARLAARGHDVVVYSRPHYSEGPAPTEHRGMRLVTLPTVQRAGFEAFMHSGLASLATVGRSFDVVHFHALGPGLFTPVSRALTRAAVVQTIHGLDDARAKWGGGAQRVLRTGGWLSARVPHEVVVVSEDLGRHYREAHGRATTYIPNGAPEPTPGDAAVLADRFGLEEQGYLVFLGRLVPEKDPQLLLKAFRQVSTNLKLVVVGDSSHTDDYTGRLKALGASDDRVVFAGFQYGEALSALLTHAALFVQPSLLEGLPITLLEAAAYGLPVVASDIAPHREVLRSPGPGRMLFRAGDEHALAEALRLSLADPAALRSGAKLLHEDVVTRYDWERATDELEETYQRAVGRRRSR